LPESWKGRNKMKIEEIENHLSDSQLQPVLKLLGLNEEILKSFFNSLNVFKEDILLLDQQIENIIIVNSMDENSDIFEKKSKKEGIEILFEGIKLLSGRIKKTVEKL